MASKPTAFFTDCVSIKKVFAEADLARIIQKAEKAAGSADKYAEVHAAGIRDAKQRKKTEKKRGRSNAPSCSKLLPNRMASSAL